jgi:outer membrane protein
MRIVIYLTLLTLMSQFAPAQTYSLTEVVLQAQLNSPASRLARTQKQISSYQFQVFKSDLNPQVGFYGEAPVFNKEYYGVRQPDGTIRYQAISQHSSLIGFGISQQLPFTGGQLSLNTNLTQFNDYRFNTRQYNATPVYLMLRQPIFAFNELKWKKRIEPLKFKESQQQYVQELESVAQEAASLYFDVLDAQSNMKIAAANLRNNEYNLEIEKKRIGLGTTTEDKLLQIELQVIKSRQELETARYMYQVSQLNLTSFIGWKDTTEIQLMLPEDIPAIQVSQADALAYAKQNRAEFTSFERKKLETARDVDQAKANRQQINLVASYGLNNANDKLGKVYNNVNDQQRFSIGFNIPVLDWGRNRARLNTARAIEELTAANNNMEETNIYREIVTLVRNTELFRLSISLAKQADTVAQRRFSIANNLYQVGKLAITDLNIAQAEKDNARRSYVSALRQYWDAYFLLRRYTLYDFENGRPLSIQR